MGGRVLTFSLNGRSEICALCQLQESVNRGAIGEAIKSVMRSIHSYQVLLVHCVFVSSHIRY